MFKSNQEIDPTRGLLSSVIMGFLHRAFVSMSQGSSSHVLSIRDYRQRRNLMRRLSILQSYKEHACCATHVAHLFQASRVPAIMPCSPGWQGDGLIPFFLHVAPA